MPKLTLYQFEECPYCAKVRSFLEKKNLTYKKFNVAFERSDKQRTELFQKTGVYTVPILRVDSKFIAESDEILEFISKTL